MTVFLSPRQGAFFCRSAAAIPFTQHAACCRFIPRFSYLVPRCLPLGGFSLLVQ